MQILYIHQNFPAQYRHIAAHLARAGGHGQVSIAKTTAGRVGGVRAIHYHIADTAMRSQNPYVLDLESKVHHGEMVQDAMVSLKRRGFTPDVVLAHPGWGEALFTKDVYPDAPRLDYCEFYYNAFGGDVNFDPEQTQVEPDTARIRSRNASALLSLESCDWGFSPTGWQRSQYPKSFQSKISVLHDGIDSAAAKPNDQVRLGLPNGTTVAKDDEVVTYVARNLEPYRGFHQFVRAAKLITERRPRTQIIVVGSDGVSYGRKLPPGETYRKRYLAETPLDEDRVHFVGKLAYEQYLKVLQVSSVHIYLTVPFVLSWSMLEAMSSGCLVLGSETPPVAEVIEDGGNGLLVDFFSPEMIANRVGEVLDHPDRMAAARAAARETILERYALAICLPRHLALINDVAERRFPPPSMAVAPPPPTPPEATATANAGPIVVAPSNLRPSLYR
ncbi:MAG: glycosyltransferase family 4 protein [Alphaproteobacteria bacterium]|jgi:glycosyltransferase involved in cell wall biosynthesis|nr:glycosyltransferase family 4 protein [Alphaproteobacteria bacterium]MDP6516954.1 glycosyltransferase family 4 protein [Alphaproteobacteria bacterium]